MKFRAAIGMYVGEQQSLGRINSPNTVRIYVSRLETLADEIHNRDPRTVGKEDIKRTLRRWNPASQAHARSIYMSFFRWAVAEGYCDSNPVEKTHPPKVKRQERYRLTLSETQAIVAAAADVRERRVVHLAVFSGLRNQELRGVQGRHFARDGWIWVSGDIGKGQRERWIPVLSELAPVVAEIRESVAGDEFVVPALRWSDRLTTVQREVGARPCSSSTLRDLVQRVARRAGIAATIGPHTLRHAFCDHVRRMTSDVVIAQALMGHANLQTTQGYMSKPSLDELARALGVGYPPTADVDGPVVGLVAANDASHSVALLSDPLFWAGVRLGSQSEAILAYIEHFRGGVARA